MTDTAPAVATKQVASSDTPSGEVEDVAPVKDNKAPTVSEDKKEEIEAK